MEFLSLVLPLNNAADRIEAVKREVEAVSQEDKLSQEVEEKLADLIAKEIELGENVEYEKHQLANFNDYNPSSAFTTINRSLSKYITFDTLTEFLGKNKMKAQEEEITAFIRRADQDLDCKVSYNEFANIITPRNNKPKSATNVKTSTGGTKKINRTGTARGNGKVIKSPNKSNTVRSIGRAITVDITGKINPLKPGKTKYPGNYTSTIRKHSASGSTSSKGRKPGSFNLNKGPAKGKKLPTTIRTITGTKFSKNPSTSSKSTYKSQTSFTKGSVRERLTRQKTLKQETIKEEITIYELIEEHLNMERRLEVMKQDLVTHDDVTLSKLIKILDPKERGYVKALEFLDILRGLKFEPERIPCYLLFDRFDSDMDGMWVYDDIKKILNPIGKDYCSILDSKNYGLDGTKLTKEAMMTFKRLIKSYLEMEEKNENDKNRVTKEEVKKTFEEFDMNNIGYFTLEDVNFIY